MKKYINPKINIALFEREDICTASGNTETGISSSKVNDVSELDTNSSVTLDYTKFVF